MGSSKSERTLEVYIFSKIRIIKNLVVLCAGFLFFFTGIEALNLLQSTLNREEGLGVVSLAVAYVSFSISALLIPKYVIQKLGTKTSLLLSMMAEIPYLASNFYPRWYTMVPAAFVTGFLSSVLWGSQSTYLNELACMYDQHLSMRWTEIQKGGCQTTRNDNPNDSGISSVSISVEKKSGNEDGSMNKNELCKNSQGSVSTSALMTKNRRMSREYTPNEPFQHKTNHGSNGKFNKTEEFSPETSETLPQNYEQFAKNNTIDSHSPSTIHTTAALFFGIHGMAYLSTRIWGNLTSYLVLRKDFPLNDITVNTNCTCGASFCNVESECIETNLMEPSKEVRYIFTGICVTLGLFSILLVAILMDPLNGDKKPVKFSLDLLMTTCNLLKKRQVLLLVPLSFYVGMGQGFYSADFTKSYVGCAWGMYHVGLVSICYGTMSAFASTLSGYLVKRLGRMPIFLAAAVVNVAASIFLLRWNPDVSRPIMFFLAAGLWGITTGIYWSQTTALYGVLFESDKEAAFGVLYLWYSLGISLSFIYHNYLCTYLKIYLLLALSSTGILGYIIMECRYSNSERK